MKKNHNAFVWLCVCCLFVITLLVSTPQSFASSTKPIEIKFGYIFHPNTPMSDMGAIPWAKGAEKATNGKIKIIHYPANSLFKSREALNAVETGIADMIHIPMGYFTGRFNLTEVLFLPFLLQSPSAEVNSRIAQALFDEIPEIQKEFGSMKLLFIYTSSPYFIASIKKPMRNMDDLKGKKIRTVGKIPIKAVKALGATPVMVPLPDTYEAASKGVIDAGLILEPMLPDFKLYEVFNYWTDVVLWPSVVFQAMNTNKWNSLPPDVQKGLMSVCGESGARFWAREGYGPQFIEQDKAMIEKEGQKWERVELDKGEIEKWRELIGKPIWKQWVADMEKKGLPGRKVLEKTLELVEKYK